LRAHRILAGLAVIVVAGPLLAYAIASATGRVDTAGDSARALFSCSAAELVGMMVAGAVVARLKRLHAETEDSSLRPAMGRSLRAARVAFWSSLLLLALQALGMVFMTALAMGLSG